MRTNMTIEQPAPVPNGSAPVWEMVIADIAPDMDAKLKEALVADMRARDALGRQRYGTPLQSNNGRDALRDAYEEALDCTVYLKAAIEGDSPREMAEDLRVAYKQQLRATAQLRSLITCRGIMEDAAKMAIGGAE